MSKVQTAVAGFKQGFNCSQAVLSTYGPELGLDREAALRLAAAFGAGMGRMASTCGAVTGAFLVLGLRYGAIQAADRQAKEKTYELVREFARKLEARNHSLICKELLGYDISTAEGFSQVKAKHLIETHCARFVRDAAEILEELSAAI